MQKVKILYEVLRFDETGRELSVKKTNKTVYWYVLTGRAPDRVKTGNEVQRRNSGTEAGLEVACFQKTQILGGRAAIKTDLL